jgi:hypothetical protein
MVSEGIKNSDTSIGHGICAYNLCERMDEHGSIKYCENFQIEILYAALFAPRDIIKIVNGNQTISQMNFDFNCAVTYLGQSRSIGFLASKESIIIEQIGI